MYKYVTSNIDHLIENREKQIYHLPKLIYQVIVKICIYIKY